eukprot:2767724-Rhodomonas_salina.12
MEEFLVQDVETHFAGTTAPLPAYAYSRSTCPVLAHGSLHIPGADVGYGATRRGYQYWREHRNIRTAPWYTLLPTYAPGTMYPVLTERMGLALAMRCRVLIEGVLLGGLHSRFWPRLVPGHLCYRPTPAIARYWVGALSYIPAMCWHTVWWGGGNVLHALKRGRGVSGIGLRAGYAMCGTDLACSAICLRACLSHGRRDRRLWAPRSRYALAPQCPVLTVRRRRLQRNNRTDPVYRSPSLRACDAIRGTDFAFCGTRPVGNGRGEHKRLLPYRFGTLPPACYAVPCPDLGFCDRPTLTLCDAQY